MFMGKDFDRWNDAKKRLDAKEDAPNARFYEREVWYVRLGVNIGAEIIGKGSGDAFSRPVLILKKHNSASFYGLPLSSTQKPGHPYYYPIITAGRHGSVLLTQGRTLSSKRLINRMVRLPEPLFDKIKQAYIATY
jgi:mRNA-degrading endonuclease toxin of MazEF toxin-antitoxin module